MNLPPDQALLGRLAVHYKLISPDQLNAAMRHAGQQGTIKLADVLRHLGFLTPKQLEWLFSAQQQYLAKQRAAQSSAAIELTPTSALPRPAPTGPEVSPTAVGVSRPATSPTPSTEKILLEVLTAEQRKHFEENHDLDFAYSVSGVGRFRGNIYRQQRGIDGVFRPIPPSPPTLEELGLPQSLGRLTDFHQGLLLVTGPAGCGKSSTMAALVNLINEQRPDHVITVEDPIEYVHASKRAVINQRQVLTQTISFGTALRAALREDPDVIVIGELRDLETISLAISAAETGHLVMATLHTNNTIRTVNRILDVFPPKQQSKIRAMVSESLRAIVSQRLLPNADGSRRVPAIEILGQAGHLQSDS